MNKDDFKKKIQELALEIRNIPKYNFDYRFSTDIGEDFFDLKNSLNYILDSILDSIRESKVSLDQLRISNKELEKAYEIIEKSDIVVFEWTLTPDVPTKFVTNNISRFGYTPEDFYSGELKDYWNFVYKEDIEKTRANVYRARKKGIDEFKHSYRVICKNKDIRWVEEWLILQRDSKGIPIAEKGILRDITQQKELADRLKESEERYRSLYENAAAVIFTYNLDGYITSVNNACTKLLGFNRSELVGKHISELIYKDNDDGTVKNYIEIALENLQKPIESEIITKENEVIVIETHNSLITRDGKPHEIQGVAQNITSRKKAEEKILHMSYHDKLTGLYNRAYFDEALHRINNNGEYPFTLIAGDMNGLKLANDAFGHKTGDDLLRKMADILVKACRKNDIICRIGGDEFTVILPNTGEEGAKMVCERIRDLCKRVKANPIQPSIALGYASKISDETSIETLIKEADDRMYKNKLNENKSISSAIISSLQATLEEKTFETKEHGERLKVLSLKLGREIGLSDSQLDELSLAAVMHDIGKIGIPDNILTKADRLTEEEWDIMKKHTEIGYQIMLSTTSMVTIGEYILAHHEAWDGSGYPRGLKGEEIPIISRIVTLIDAFDVMTHIRPYSPAMTKAEALEEVKRCSGTQFDPYLVETFLKII